MGNTPLHHAAFDSHIELVRILLERNVEANAWDDERSTPLHYATQREPEQTEAAANQVRETATHEHEGLTTQQQQQEAAEVRVELEQQQKRQEEALCLWQLKCQQWEEQTATKFHAAVTRAGGGQ
ncbi:hypothetical protein EDB84DRAFT_1570278 [Lactarius hengduanensis]|nr:hypothetical protein EDB84DRAFT_1570278 [Lactarius hengduanensis]